jgi:nicotinate-nucleotide pyrophosphorylase (carboxylating)
MTATRGSAAFPEHGVLVDLALSEDLGTGAYTAEQDVTAAWTVPAGTRAKAVISARASGVIAGLELVRSVFLRLATDVSVEAAVADGQRVAHGDVIVRVCGPASALLAGERTALNFLQRLSGVATLTRAFVDAVAGTTARITDTRKTTPGFRLLEKYAVRQGGGTNHRMGLHDAVLIKENHAACAGGVGAAVAQARRASRAAGRSIQIYAEAETLDEVLELIESGADRIMLDNMGLDAMSSAVMSVRAASPEIEIEATGGITLSNVHGVAGTGVDLISIGALTHSAAALDLSLLLDLEDPPG